MCGEIGDTNNVDADYFLTPHHFFPPKNQITLLILICPYNLGVEVLGLSLNYKGQLQLANVVQIPPPMIILLSSGESCIISDDGRELPHTT